MSNTRTVPGQQLSSRLSGRMDRSSRVGGSPTLYARMGLTHPSASVGVSRRRSGGAAAFGFMDRSARQSRAQRRYRSRSRMFRRMGRAGSVFAARALYTAPRKAPVTMPRGIPTLGLSSLVWLSPPEPEPELEETAAEAPRPRRRHRVASRSAARTMQGMQLSVDELRAVQGEAAGRRARTRPLDRAVHQASTPRASASPVAAAASRVSSASRPVRRRRALGSVTSMDLLADDVGAGSRAQASAAASAVRQMSGPYRAMARAEVSHAVRAADGSALGVAAARMPEPGIPKRGLRPIMGSSPALVALQAEPEPVVEAEPLPTQRRRVDRPAPQPTTHRSTPAARVATEARTQRVVGRAGPQVATPTGGGASSASAVSRHALETATSSTQPVTPRATRAARATRRPTAWLVDLARDTAPEPGVAVAGRALGRSEAGERASTRRISARAERPDAVGALRSARSPTAYAAGTRRSRLFAPAAVTASLAPAVQSESVEAGPAPQRRTRGAYRPRTRTSAQRATRAASSPSATRPPATPVASRGATTKLPAPEQATQSVPSSASDLDPRRAAPPVPAPVTPADVTPTLTERVAAPVDATPTPTERLVGPTFSEDDQPLADASSGWETIPVAARHGDTPAGPAWARHADVVPAVAASQLSWRSAGIARAASSSTLTRPAERAARRAEASTSTTVSPRSASYVRTPTMQRTVPGANLRVRTGGSRRGMVSAASMQHIAPSSADAEASEAPRASSLPASRAAARGQAVHRTSSRGAMLVSPAATAHVDPGVATRALRSSAPASGSVAAARPVLGRAAALTPAPGALATPRPAGARSALAGVSRTAATRTDVSAATTARSGVTVSRGGTDARALRSRRGGIAGDGRPADQRSAPTLRAAMRGSVRQAMIFSPTMGHVIEPSIEPVSDSAEVGSGSRVAAAVASASPARRAASAAAMRAVGATWMLPGSGGVMPTEAAASAPAALRAAAGRVGAGYRPVVARQATGSGTSAPGIVATRGDARTTTGSTVAQRASTGGALTALPSRVDSPPALRAALRGSSARRSRAAVSAPSTVLSAAPTAYVDAAAETAPPVRSERPSVSARAVLRASVRDLPVAQVDGRGKGLTVGSGAAHVAAADAIATRQATPRTRRSVFARTVEGTSLHAGSASPSSLSASSVGGARGARAAAPASQETTSTATTPARLSAAVHESADSVVDRLALRMDEDGALVPSVDADEPVTSSMLRAAERGVEAQEATTAAADSPTARLAARAEASDSVSRPRFGISSPTTVFAQAEPTVDSDADEEAQIASSRAAGRQVGSDRDRGSDASPVDAAARRAAAAGRTSDSDAVTSSSSAASVRLAEMARELGIEGVGRGWARQGSDRAMMRLGAIAGGASVVAVARLETASGASRSGGAEIGASLARLTAMSESRRSLGASPTRHVPVSHDMRWLLPGTAPDAGAAEADVAAGGRARVRGGRAAGTVSDSTTAVGTAARSARADASSDTPAVLGAAVERLGRTEQGPLADRVRGRDLEATASAASVRAAERHGLADLMVPASRRAFATMHGSSLVMPEGGGHPATLEGAEADAYSRAAGPAAASTTGGGAGGRAASRGAAAAASRRGGAATSRGSASGGAAGGASRRSGGPARRRGRRPQGPNGLGAQMDWVERRSALSVGAGPASPASRVTERSFAGVLGSKAPVGRASSRGLWAPMSPSMILPSDTLPAGAGDVGTSVGPGTAGLGGIGAASVAPRAALAADPAAGAAPSLAAAGQTAWSALSAGLASRGYESVSAIAGRVAARAGVDTVGDMRWSAPGAAQAARATSAGVRRSLIGSPSMTALPAWSGDAVYPGVSAGPGLGHPGLPSAMPGVAGLGLTAAGTSPALEMAAARGAVVDGTSDAEPVMGGAAAARADRRSGTRVSRRTGPAGQVVYAPGTGVGASVTPGASSPAARSGRAQASRAGRTATGSTGTGSSTHPAFRAAVRADRSGTAPASGLTWTFGLLVGPSAAQVDTGGPAADGGGASSVAARAEARAAGATGAVSRSATSGKSGRGSTLARSPVGTRRPAGASPELSLFSAPADGAADHEEDAQAEAPGWARRAVASEAPDRVAGAIEGRVQRQAEARDALLALSGARGPADMIRLITERGSSMRSLSKSFPVPARRLVERIAALGDEALLAVEPGRAAAAQAEGPSAIRRQPAMDGQVLRPRGRRLGMPLAGGSATHTQGVGPSNVMRLANKLMNLIHLAEVERRVAEAQSQVRMSEEAPGAGEGSVGAAGAAASGQDANIAALRRDVNQYVTDEQERRKERAEEDPDGPNGWF